MQERIAQLLRKICTVACMICADTDAHEYMAKELIKAGAFLPPCRVGDTLCILLEDDFHVHKWFISEERVTEVGTRGVWTSGYDQTRDDMGTFWDYADMGTEWFTDRVDAEAALKAKEGAE